MLVGQTQNLEAAAPLRISKAAEAPNYDIPDLYGYGTAAVTWFE